MTHYHAERNHQGLENRLIAPRVKRAKEGAAVSTQPWQPHFAVERIARLIAVTAAKTASNADAISGNAPPESDVKRKPIDDRRSGVRVSLVRRLLCRT